MRRTYPTLSMVVVAGTLSFPISGARADRSITVDGFVDPAWTGTAQYVDTTPTNYDLSSVRITNDNASGTDGNLYVLGLFKSPPTGNKSFHVELTLPSGVAARLDWDPKTRTAVLVSGTISRPITVAASADTLVLEFAIPYALLNQLDPVFKFGSDDLQFAAYTKTGSKPRDTLPDSGTLPYWGTRDPSTSAVTFAGAQAREVPDGGVVVSWQTAFETSNAAFRVEKRAGPAWIPVALVPGRLDAVGDGRYEVVDAEGRRSDSYRVVDIDMQGRETAHPVSKANLSGRQQTPVAKKKTPQRPRHLVGEALVDVLQEGLARVSGAQLADYGLEASRTRVISPSGAAVPSIADGDDVVFWAAQPRRDYDAADTYRLVSSPPMPLSPAPGARRGSSPTSVPVTLHFEKDVFRWSGSSTEANFVWASSIDRFGPASAVLPVESPVGAATLTVALEGGTTYPVNPDHLVAISLNGTLLGEVAFDGWNGARFEFQVPSGLLSSGGNVLSVAALRVAGATYDAVYLDWAELRYQRLAGTAGFISELGEGTVLDIANADTLVLDVTDPAKPRQVRRSSDGRFVVPNKGLRRVAVTSLSRSAVAAIRPAAEPMAPVRGADYVVVYAPGFEESAEQLVTAREKDGLLAVALPMPSIEMSLANGARGPAALKRLFAEMRQWEPVPQAVVLLGGASQDPRDIGNRGVEDLVPTGMLRTAHGVWAESDLALATMPGAPLPSFDIGRIPATSAEEAMKAVEKLLRAEGQDPVGRAVAVFDGGRGANKEFIALAASVTASKANVAVIDLSASSLRTALPRELGVGADSLFYAGHGQPLGWGEMAWSSADALGARNAHLPVLYSLTCYDGMFAYTYGSSLAAAMVLSAGGARAAFSPSSVLSPTQHEAVLAALLANDGAATLGARVRGLRSALISQGGAVEEAAYIYNLLGDPLSPAD